MALLCPQPNPKLQRLVLTCAHYLPPAYITTLSSETKRLQADPPPRACFRDSFIPLARYIYVTTSQRGAFHVPCLSCPCTECCSLDAHLTIIFWIHRSKRLCKQNPDAAQARNCKHIHPRGLGSRRFAGHRYGYSIFGTPQDLRPLTATRSCPSW